MNKGIKKSLSILLVMIITLSVTPVGAVTATAADIDYLTYKIENGEATITDCDETVTGEITIPDEIEGAKVTGIGTSAFRNCSLLQKIIIPDSVVSIGMQAFNGCTFEEITIPDGVTKINDGLFMYCSSLEKVNLPENLISIGAQVFYDCVNLSEITIPETVTSIGMQTFYGCESLINIKIPKDVTVLSNRLFSGCSSLEEISLPNGLVSIGNYAFASCSALGDVNIPKTVTTIGESAFSECDALHSVKIPDGVTRISDYLFYGCSSLQCVDLPDTITSIGAYAFFNCTLIDVFYRGSEEQWNDISVSLRNEKLTSTTVHFNYRPNTGLCGESATWNYYEDTKKLVIVGGGEMYDFTSPEECEWYDLKDNIEFVMVSGKVESVGANAFNGYENLKEVYLGSSTQLVGENAFANCSKLSLVSSTASDLSVEENAFDGCNERITFVCYPTNNGILENAADNAIKVSFDSEKNALKFNGDLTVYHDLNYEFLNRFLMNNNGADYVFFSKLIFHGVEPDIVDVEDLENDVTADYLTFTNLYISLRAVKNGTQEDITFAEMLTLLENGDYDAFIFDLKSDEGNQEVVVEPAWKKTIDNFVEDVVKAASKIINFFSRLFRRKK